MVSSRRECAEPLTPPTIPCTPAASSDGVPQQQPQPLGISCEEWARAPAVQCEPFDIDPELPRRVRYIAYGWQFLSLLLTAGYIVLSYIEEYYPSPIIWAFLSLLHIAQFIWLVTVKRGAGYLDPDVTQNVVGQSAHAMPPHYCKNSKMYLPRRAKYCNKCGYCVLTFDHHCFWIGGCVGEFNHRSFFAFLWYTAILSGTDLAILATNFNVEWWYLMVFVGAVLVCLFSSGLAMFHTYLAMTAQTTWECLSRQHIDYLQPFPSDVNPFSQGVRKNVMKFLRRRRGRGEGDQKFEMWDFQWKPGENGGLTSTESNWRFVAAP